jgi:FkbM family methyltransferase
MLISVEELKSSFWVSRSGILHVGAHLAEEWANYERAEWSAFSRIIWVESQHEPAQKLILVLDPQRNKIINATVWSKSGKETSFHVANNSQSSSFFAFGTHTSTYPSIKFDSDQLITTVRLDEIINESDDISFVNPDILGAE